MFHANAWGLVYAAVVAGADLVLPDRFMKPETLVELIETQRVTLAGAVPTVWTDVLGFLKQHPEHRLSSLRLIGCGGSAVPEHLMRAYDDGYGITMAQLWGMTETSPIASVALPPSDTPPERHWALRSTARRPLCGVRARIVDSAGVPVPRDGSPRASCRSKAHGSPGVTTGSPR